MFVYIYFGRLYLRGGSVSILQPVSHYYSYQGARTAVCLFFFSKKIDLTN